ncbi:hypothetical protein ACTWJ9_33370 (plasmid) [Streptomyces sp. GDS52]|uniref:hypothetical protein n=1 Tax=Streptomyces sp. GDS52 TaxID=3406419 RepID=UPI003FD3FAC3
MTETVPTPPAVPAQVDAAEWEAFETMRADAVLGGRAMSSGEFLAGLIANAQLATVGRPDKLARDLFPGVDPVVVQTIWDRALAVGLHAGRRSASPRLYRDELDRIAGQLEEAGFHAMAGMVARSRRLVAPEVHPADGEAADGH